MNPTFLVGILGALILVIGSAYPIEKVSHPAKAVKNWLYAAGGSCMFLYALMNYLQGGAIFFVMLQILVMVSTVLMMLDTSDAFDTPLIIGVGIAMIGWSLYLFEGYNTIFFIIGLSGIGLGYALDTGSFKRNVALFLGSALIAIFSYIENNMIFFWLNMFFAVFSGYYALKLRKA